MVVMSARVRKTNWGGHLSTWAMALVVAGTFLAAMIVTGTSSNPDKHWETPLLASLVLFALTPGLFKPLQWWEAAAALAANVAGGYAAGRYGHPAGFFQYFAWGLVQFLLLGWWRAYRRARAVDAASGETPPMETSGSRLHRRHGLVLVMEDHPYSRCLAIGMAGVLLLAGLAMAAGVLSVARWLNPLLMAFCFFVVDMVVLKPLRWREMATMLGLNAAAALSAGIVGTPSGFKACLLWFLGQFAVLFFWHAFTRHFVPPPRRARTP